MSTRRFLALALILFTALTTIMTFPQILHLGDAVHDEGDPLLVAWALSWIADQLPRAPAQLFDANIFYPERATLAFSESFLAPGILMAPLRWLGAGPVLVHNLLLLSGFIASGVGVALLVRSLTSSIEAAMLSGVVFAFLPFRFDHYPHLQLQQTQWLPLAMWAFHRLLERGLVRDGVLFGLFAACQVLSCLYYGLFLGPYFTIVCGAMLIVERRVTRARITALTIAAAITIVAAAPAARAYLIVRSVVGERHPLEVVRGSATWTDYLAPNDTNIVYGNALKSFMQPERRLFPGFIAVALAIVGLWPPFSVARAAYALGLLLAFDLSLGFNGFVYRPLYDYVLPFRALRIPARMGVMVGFSLAVLGGYGTARILERFQSPSLRRALVAAIGLLVLVECASMPIALQPIPPVPETYADLVRDRGSSPRGAMLEFPMSPGDDTTYMYYSTWHWEHLVNGYSGFFPPSYVDMYRALEKFPDDRSMSAVRERRVRYLAIHGERLRGDRYETLIPQLDKRADLKLISRRPSERVGQHGEISLYRVLY